MRILCLLFLTGAALRADVTLPALFSDHMLIQRDRPARVWGKADPGEAVTVKFRGQTVSATADSLGRWSLFLAATPAGGPAEMTVEGKNSLTVSDVLVGEVWVGSGQSNMVWPVRQSDNAEQEIAAASYPEIRFFRVANAVSDTPLDDVKGKWESASPETAAAFSGVGYFFARRLLKELKSPVGIIQSAWGGTPAESWISYPSLAADPALISIFADWGKLLADYPLARTRYDLAMKRFEQQAAEAKTQGKEAPRRPAPPAGPGHQWTPGGLYNAMIAPLTPYAIRGVIWYQGEKNAGKARSYVYRRLFPAMIEDWRRAWGQGDFPFLFVQLANYKAPPTAQYPELREAQLFTLRNSANTGMAVTIDIGNPADIHPRNKQDVGARLALAARALAYGERIEYSGPLFRQATKDGAALRVWFDHAASLNARGGELTGFALAGPDGKFLPAQARIDGSTVLVSSPEVANPVAVRYGFEDAPACNLYNEAGLPASPFRSDDWAEPRLYK
jgi:sialate O-acetylesterase